MSERRQLALCQAVVVAVVFIFGVEDIDADGWMAELAVVADSRGDAHRILRNRGVKKKQFGNEGRPVRELALSDVADWLDRCHCRVSPSSQCRWLERVGTGRERCI